MTIENTRTLQFSFSSFYLCTPVRNLGENIKKWILGLTEPQKLAQEVRIAQAILCVWVFKYFLLYFF
uniref:Uncharacterized protein n=1 Tax=Solanum tuberosum TaxID=4113 RepID=M1C910_SOLTU